MISIEKPDDMISISLYNILSYRKDMEYHNLIQNWNKTIIFEIEQFYPVGVNFSKGEISFKRNISPSEADLIVKMSLQTLLDLAYERLNPIRAFLKRKLKIKGIYKVRTLMKFMKIFLDTIKMMAKDPNDKYYKQASNPKTEV